MANVEAGELRNLQFSVASFSHFHIQLKLTAEMSPELG